jgi:hypothetical protein
MGGDATAGLAAAFHAAKRDVAAALWESGARVDRACPCCRAAARVLEARMQRCRAAALAVMRAAGTRDVARLLGRAVWATRRWGEWK